ncbi:hypothetical protein LC609_20625 [Nostoc sp. XA013]|nr:hypothetical protein [Nostoc sp. XA013]
MPRSVSYHEKLVKHLQDPLEAASYIEVVLEEGDPKMLGKALKNRWYQSVEIRRVTPYVSGKVIWFIAPVSEYHRLASFYPHHRRAAYTHYLLNSASTFFKGLKPPHLLDSEYLD